MKPDKFFILLCVMLIILNIIMIGMRFPVSGDDFHIFCGGVKCFEAGHNPYLVNELKAYSGNLLSFPYLPINILYFTVLCFPGNFIDLKITYYVLWGLFLLGTYLIAKKTDRHFQPLLCSTLLITGFVGTYWNFLTGNSDLLEMFVLALIFFMISRKRYACASVLLVLVGLIKIIPLAFGILFVFSEIPKRKKIALIFLMAALFIAVNALSYFIFPELFHSWYLTLTGKIGPQHNAYYETGAEVNIAPLWLIKDISGALFHHNQLAFLFLYFLFCAAIVVFFLRFMRKEKREFLDIFSLGIIVISLLMPRVKPYHLALVLLPVYFLIKECGVKTQLLAIVIVSLAPVIVRIMLSISGIHNSIPRYEQIICLCAFYILFLIKDSPAATSFLGKAGKRS